MDISITHKGKKYPVKELTIETWIEIMKNRGLLDDTELFIKTIELTTDLTKDEILNADPAEIIQAGEVILYAMNTGRRNVEMTITHKGVEYGFVDIHNITFGQFIDIDTFLTKDENYKLQNLSELASYLYTEKNTKYGEKPAMTRKELFKDLPMKYMESSVFFLASLAKTSEILTKIYSESKMIQWTLKTRIVLALIGDGIRQSLLSLRTRFGYLTSLLASPLLSVSIIFLTLWTLIKSKIKNAKNRKNE